MADLRGRERELGEIRRLLQDARDGRGGVALIRGEAGLGKSALAEVAARVAEKSGFQVLVGRAWELGEAPAYFPVRPGLRALGIEARAASEADAFALWEDALDRLAGRDRPLLWVLEDLHAADAQSLDLLAYLARPLRAVRALILGTVRAGDPRGPADRLARLARDAATLDLAPLGRADVRALASRVAEREVPDAALDAWMARTGGNPLFVVECARAARGGRAVETALPDTLVQGVAEQLRSLPTSTRRATEVGALLGREFAAARVGRVVGWLPAAVIDALSPAERAGLVEELAPGRFRFGHALVRDAIAGSVAPSERRAAHVRAVAALAEEGDEPEVLVERARHALEALPDLPIEEARAAVRRAVAALADQGAHDRAFALARRWVDAGEAAPGPAEWLELAERALAAGRHDELGRAARAALATADPVIAARAALLLGTNQRPGQVDRAYVRVLQDLVADFRGPPEWAARLRARLAAAQQPARDPTAAIALARGAVADARALGDPAALRDVLTHAGSALTYFVPAAETRALGAELVELALAAGDTGGALRAFPRVVIGALDLGDFGSFDREADRMMAIARAFGHPRSTWRALVVGSARALARGRFDESERLLVELEQVAALTDDPAVQMGLTAHRLIAAWRWTTRTTCGRPSRTRSQGSRRSPAPTTAPSWRCSRRGSATPTSPRASSRRVPADSPIHGTFGEAAALGGTPADREEALAALLPLADRELHTAPIAVTYEGPVARVIGRLEAALDRLDAAAERLLAAEARCRAHDLRPWVARIGVERGEVLRAAGREGEARAALTAAAAEAASLGLRRLEDRARAALGEAARPATASAGAASVTREGEVWRVARGSREARVRDSRGVQLLARLVATPGERIHSLALDGGEEARALDRDAGELLDERAVGAYRARLAALQGVGGEAAAHERAAIEGELRRAVGLGGRLRRAGSASERARINVTRRLKDAIARIAEADAELGRHLAASVQTGTWCSYDPERGCSTGGNA